MFLFSSFTSLGHKDIKELKKSDVIQDDDGYYLDLDRSKTGMIIKQYLVTYAVDIYKKYSTHIETLPDNLIFPYRTLDKYNKALKIIAANAGISKNLSSNIARHTCKQLLPEANIEQLEIQNSIMGHSNRNKISSVYYEVQKSKLLEAKNKFDTYLISNFSKSNL